MRISEEELAARRSAFAARLEERGLRGAVLFDPHYVHYYSGFFFIPTFDAKSRNFYLRAAIEDPRPILGHEGIPGHFLQLSIAHALPNEIRREHGDGPGYSLYVTDPIGNYLELSFDPPA